MDFRDTMENGGTILTPIPTLLNKTSSLQIRSNHMLCTVTDIRGDYAYIKYDDTGIVSEVAIALLPFGTDVGDRLKFENYEFTQA